MKSIIQMIDDANVVSPEDEAFAKKMDNLIHLPLQLSSKNQGKQLRVKTLQTFKYFMELEDEDFQATCDGVQLGHVASLLIDDIQDESLLRRGYPAAYTVYGIPKTVLCVNYIIVGGLISNRDRVTAEQIRPFCDHFNGALLGQAEEMKWRDTGKCPTEEEYLKMIIGKTGRGFIAALEGLNNCSKTTKVNATRIGACLTLVFQITDDLNNLTNPRYFKQKGYCDDLEEGKFGFPIIHAIRSRPDDKRVIEIVQQRPKDYETKRRCVELLEEFGSFDYTKKQIQLYKDMLAKEVEYLGPNPYLPELYEAIGNVY